jgi:biopolymer transport protein ExbB/TolQ
MEQLTKLLKPTTENLYKFLGTLGLLILAVSLAFPYIRSRALVMQTMDLKKQQDLMHLELESCLEHIESLATELDRQKEALDSIEIESLTAQDLQQLKAKTEKLQVKAEELRTERKEIESRKIEIAAEMDKINYLGGELRMLWSLSPVGGLLGTVTLAVGFRLWYKLQRYRDMILRNEALTERATTNGQSQES